MGYIRLNQLPGAIRSQLICAQQQRRIAPCDVAAFVVQDDEAGPFRLLWVSELIDSAGQQFWRNHPPPFRVDVTGTPAEGHMAEVVDGVYDIVTPKPEGIWLTGADAETIGARMLKGFVAGIAEEGGGGSQAWLRLRGSVLHDERQVALRTYMVPANRFKRGFAERIGDDRVAELAGVTPMPRFVAVVEAVDRNLRRAQDRDESVIATIVVDASSPREPTVLFAWLPGYAIAHEDLSEIVDLVRPPDGGRLQFWRDAPAGAIRTGRRDRSKDDRTDPRDVASMAKGAVPRLAGAVRGWR